jgi:hypothetical protein
MGEQVIGGTGGGACPSCGQFSNACQCAAQIEKRAKGMADVAALEERRKAIYAELGEVNAKLSAYKVKCPTCRCRILPWEVCRCCAEPMCRHDLP